jgi:precorrin-6A/cobalt-precorrin-6A reductase
VLGGTLDSRILTEALIAKGKEVCYSSVTNIATDQIVNDPKLIKISGQMDSSILRETLKIYNIDLCIDATHPYAREISENAIWACDAMNINYIRFERPSHIDDGKDIKSFETYEEVEAYLMTALEKTTTNVLLTTGSRQLEFFQGIKKERLYVRVLPTAGVLKKCENLGYLPRQIIGMQGPFSVDLNYAMMRDNNIGFMITKDSGDIGGIKEKVKAARQAGAEIIFIRRPVLVYPKVVTSIKEAVAMRNY